MRTNLIQTYMNSASMPSKKDRELDINYVLSNRTFIKPLQANGHLINNNILDTPSVLAQDLVYDAKSLNKAAKGKANDHELGKINDIGMKAGGLVLAAYLMTRKQTPLTKAMELVGLASFFGAMSLWPKIALQLPAKLIHGFDIRKEYEDSFGRKKMFFQDPQYLPWDLVDDKRINKIGDRMGVPKDIPNRREFIQEKMKKTAIQNNTLWMLTAGFATPITSALICNLCEKPLNKYLGTWTSERADKLLINDNLGSASKKYVDKASESKLNKLIEDNAGKPLTEELTKNIKQLITKDIDGVTSKSIERDLNEVLGLNDKKFEINKTVIENLIKRVQKNIEEVVPSAKNCTPDAETFLKSLSEKGLLNKGLGEREMKLAIHAVGKEIKIALKQNNIPENNIHDIIHKLINGNQDETISSALKTNQVTILDKETASKLKNISNILTDFKAKQSVLNEYIYWKAAAAPETNLANSWNEVTSSLPKLLNISDKEITETRHDRKLAGKLLREKLELITSNEKEYEKTFQAIVEKISQMDAKIKTLDISKDAKGVYETNVDLVFDETAKMLRENGMFDAADSLVGKNGVIQGSLKHTQLSYVRNRLLGVRSSMYRLLNTMDFYKRISTMENIPALHSSMPREVKEEIVEFCKKLSIEGTTADYMTKFYELRNPNPNIADLSNIEVKDGKVINKYLNQAVQGGRTNLPNDKIFFQEVMKLLYENELHPQTSQLLSNFVIKNELDQYRHLFAHEVGNSPYFAKPHHLLHGYENPASSYTKFLRVGLPPDQMLSGVIKETFNTRKWLKMFGGFGAGLLGVTILSQFFFGKMKNPEGIKHD